MMLKVHYSLPKSQTTQWQHPNWEINHDKYGKRNEKKSQMDKAKGKKMKIQSTNHAYCYNFSMFFAVISPWQLEKNLWTWFNQPNKHTIVMKMIVTTTNLTTVISMTKAGRELQGFHNDSLGLHYQFACWLRINLHIREIL